MQRFQENRSSDNMKRHVELHINVGGGQFQLLLQILILKVP